MKATNVSPRLDPLLLDAWNALGEAGPANEGHGESDDFDDAGGGEGGWGGMLTSSSSTRKSSSANPTCLCDGPTFRIECSSSQTNGVNFLSAETCACARQVYWNLQEISQAWSRLPFLMLDSQEAVRMASLQGWGA